MLGEVESDDLFTFFELLIMNRDYNATKGIKMTSVWKTFVPSWVTSYFTGSRRNDPIEAKKNIHMHYDLGNEFFSSFLDPETMMYSCGIWTNSTKTLGEAQFAKLDSLISKSGVGSGDFVLDLGCGWGGLTMRLVQRGCKVHSITLSEEQFKHVSDLAKRHNCGELLTVELVDYRLLQVETKFNAIISCEMIEAIGHDEYPNFFRHCERLLQPGGRLVVQTSSLPDHRYENHRRSFIWMQKHMFPGALLPSFSALTNAMAQHSTFTVESMENIGTQYTRTLMEWRNNYWGHINHVRALGFDEVFIRKWDYYFVYCAAGFKTKTLGVLQIVFILHPK
jgi:cyclopropane-fatty-acyl-phospholipid synthase